MTIALVVGVSSVNAQEIDSGYSDGAAQAVDPSDVPLASDLPDAPPMRRVVTNLTRGIRLAGAHISLAQSASDPNVLYLGTRHGRINVSRDGGLSWEENAALISRGRFFGSIRPAGEMSGILDRWISPSPISISRVSGVKLESRGSAERTNDGGEVGTRTGGDLNPGDAMVGELTGFESSKNGSAAGTLRGLYGGMVQPTDGGGGGGGGGRTSSLAVGLRARAPWLAYQVRRKRNWAIGVALQQSLVLKGTSRTTIHHLAVNPTDSNDVLAATDDGLRRSRDGGYSWPLILTGATAAERQMHHVVRHPTKPSTIFVGTYRGLRVSYDDGDNFEKVIHRHVIGSNIRWVEFDRSRSDFMYVATTSGLMRSTDGGQFFRRVHRSPWPALNRVNQVRVEPGKPDRVWMATEDGLLVSRNDGKNFDRVGGLLFTGKNIRRISFGAQPGNVVVGTIRDLWETTDGGETWRNAYFGPIQWDVRNLIADQRKPGDFLIATTAEVLHFGAAVGRSVGREVLERFKRMRAKEPTADEAVIAALKQAGVYRPELMAYRRGARLRGLFPFVTAALRISEFSGNRAFTNLFYDELPVRLRGGFSTPIMISASASWKLDNLVYTGRESIARRIGRTNRYGEDVVTRTVIALHQERSRLLFEALVVPGFGRTRLMRDIRIEELTAHLNQLTGNLFEPYEALSRR